jgi:DNA-binding transcriptional MerR regulator
MRGFAHHASPLGLHHGLTTNTIHRGPLRPPIDSIRLDPARTYSTAEVAKATGATLRQLQAWAERGKITPDISSGVRRYSPTQAIAAGVYYQLMRKGAGYIVAKSALESLSREDLEGAAYLVTDGSQVLIQASPQAVLDAQSRMRGCWTVSLRNSRATLACQEA